MVQNNRKDAQANREVQEKYSCEKKTHYLKNTPETAHESPIKPKVTRFNPNLNK